VRFADVSDGLSNTVMVGEKHIPEGKFGAGWYDGSTYNGDYPRCWTRVLDVPPMGDAPTSNRRDSGWRFGSWHPGVVPYLFADGAVRTISTIKPPANLQALGAYNDGMETPRW
jgi:prepilin-type processing-associated H-X9-DG protein